MSTKKSVEELRELANKHRLEISTALNGTEEQGKEIDYAVIVITADRNGDGTINIMRSANVSDDAQMHVLSSIIEDEFDH